MKTFKLASIIGLTIICLSQMAFGVFEPDPSIVVYFDFDDESGDKVTDLSETGNDGAIHNAEWVEGKFGNALEFNGEDSYVEVTANPTLNITDAITMMAWVYKTEFLIPENNGETIVSKKQGGAYCLEVTGWENAVPEKLDTEIRISGNYHRVASPDSLPLDRWVHTAATYDGENVRVYMDGELVAEESWPGKIDINGAHLYVGAESDGGQPDATHGFFKGMIDEVAIFDEAISTEEIKTLMDVSSSVKPLDKLSVVWSNIKN